MADNGNGAKDTVPAAAANVHGTAAIDVPANEATGATNSDRHVAEEGALEPSPLASEWTASDARGPLNPASGTDVTPPAEPLGEAATLKTTPPISSTALPISSTVSPAPSSSVDAGATAPRRSAAGSIFAGLIAGALGGAGTYALMHYMSAGGGQQNQALNALTARVNALDSLSARVDALSNRPDPQSSIDALKSSVARLEGKTAGVGEGGASTGQPSTAAAPLAAFDAGPLEGRIAALQTGLDALRKDDAASGGGADSLQGKVASLAAGLAGMQKDASDAQAGLTDLRRQQRSLADQQKSLADQQSSLAGQQKDFGGEQQALRSGQKTLEGKVSAPALAVVADSLVQQIGRGLPYATQVDALASLGADPARVAILRQGADKGVPSPKALADMFAPLADPIASTARRAPPGAGFMDRMKSGLFSMVSIRSEGDTTGTGIGARVSRIQDDLAHDDVADAYATWVALPAEAKAKSEAWGAFAKTEAEAMTAARALQRDAIAALGAKKS